MRQLDRDSLPHMVECLSRIAVTQWHTFWARLAAHWWGVQLGTGCAFNGLPRFRRHPRSEITIGSGCKFNSSPVSNLMGVDRPCIISTLTEGAHIYIGPNCGFSGTVIGCATKIVLGENVRCGANTLITDTDWHTDDPRTGPDAPVKIEKGVWLGVNVIVLKGVTIGENTLVAAGSLVTRSLPANVVAGGVPAKVLKEIDAHQPVVKE
jgi:acetyltransferase-like isoleucine patch superfamily enzyme